MKRIVIAVLSLGLAFSAYATDTPRPSKKGIRATGTLQPNTSTFATVTGNPLSIHVGNDLSFQVYNSTISATTGQIFPNDCNSTADMGIFVTVGTTLYHPDFGTPCGTATPWGSDANNWVPVSMSAVSGAGTSASPFTVTVVADAGATGVRNTMTVTYVNGENFFRITNAFTGPAATAAKIFEAGDIYLADSDSGLPYLESASQSPGGQTCPPAASYTILFIPLTPATAYSAHNYDDVWTQIVAQQLPSTVATGCIDNGAALQWNRTLSTTPTVIQSAVSFGAIPSIATFNITSVTPPQGSQGATLTVNVTGTGFQAGTTFNFGSGITVTSTTINSATSATVTLAIAPTATPGFRDVVGTQSPGGLTYTYVNGFEVVAVAVVATAVPALSDWSLLALALFLGIAGFLATKRI